MFDGSREGAVIWIEYSMSSILLVQPGKSSMPRISEQLRKDLFLESLRKRVRHLYIYGESHPTERELITSKLEGFLEAALMLRICDRDEAQLLIDQERHAIFGLTRSERSAIRRQEGITDTPDWSPYESPATDRMSAKKRRARRYGAKTKITKNDQCDTSAVKRING